MKYLKKFNLRSDYDDYVSSDFVRPNVSYIVEDNDIKYNSILETPSMYKMVDLGLPSGLKWADRNIGANSPEDAGLYFQWGDTKGYTADQVGVDKVFNIDYYWDSMNGPYFNYNKYAADKLTILEASDDAAAVNMGYDWRMPTYDELTELINNTNKIFIDKDGNEVSSTTSDNLKGVKLVSKTNGNSIFIPASGHCYDSSLYDVGVVGYLWSSVLHNSNSKFAKYVCFNRNGGLNTNKDNRYYGFTVRGVHA